MDHRLAAYLKKVLQFYFEKHFVFMPRYHIYFIECPRDAKLSHEVG